MERYILHIIHGAEHRTRQFLEQQVRDPADLQYGGLRGDIWEAKPTVYALSQAVAVYLNPQSCFYRDAALCQAMNLALDFVARTQRSDGYIDYPSCNFMSAPDTAFCFKRLYAAYRLLVRYDVPGDEALALLRQKYLALLHSAVQAICAGGFHTPNHRWGITAALLQGAELFAGEPALAARLKARAALYLAEGVDGDDDGEYAERSTGNYNAVVNNAMLAIYQQTGDDRYLGYVRRNLAMMLQYVDPDDTIFTQNSTRQDKGKLEYMDKYFYQYLYLAANGGGALYDAAAHKIIRDNAERGALAPECLQILMNHPEMLAHSFTHYGFLDTYRKYFKHAGVLRTATPAYTYTVLRGKSAFLYFKCGAAQLCVKIGESYCDIRNFIPQQLDVQAQGCTLQGTAQGWYYQPFQTPPQTSDWWQMDQSKRDKLNTSKLHTTLQITEQPDGLDLTLKTEGLDRLPLRLEICVPANATLEHEAFRLDTNPGGELILRAGTVRLYSAGKTLELGPGFGEHAFHGHYSGEERNTEGYTLYCNAYTPFEKTFHLRVK